MNTKLKLAIAGSAIVLSAAVIATPHIIKAKDTTVNVEPIATPEATTSSIDTITVPTDTPVATKTPAIQAKPDVSNKPEPTEKPTPTPDTTDYSNGSFHVDNDTTTGVVRMTPRPQ